jgi:nuclear pore complex protein Nup155
LWNKVIYLGDPYDKYKPIFKHSSITDNAIQMCRQQSRIFDPSDFKLESIHVISKAESKRIHLMAVTNSGFRLYFTHHRDAFRTLSMPSINTSAEPNTLELGHIRIPPPKPTRSAGEFPSLYTLNYYDCGIWLSVNPKTDEVDTIQATAVAAEKPTINNSNTNLSSMMVVCNSKSTFIIYLIFFLLGWDQAYFLGNIRCIRL